MFGKKNRDSAREFVFNRLTNPGEQAGNHLPDTKKKGDDMSEPTKSKVHLPLPDEPGYWWRQEGETKHLFLVWFNCHRKKHFRMSCDDGQIDMVVGEGIGVYWTKAEISDPPPIPEPPKLPRLFRWKGMVGVVFELDCHSTRNIILQDNDHLQYHHQDDWLRKHASEIEWIDEEGE